MKEPINNPILQTWTNLNDFMRNATEEDCEKLSKEEREGRNRIQFIRRIHSRMNRVRADRERNELLP